MRAAIDAVLEANGWLQPTTPSAMGIAPPAPVASQPGPIRLAPDAPPLTCVAWHGAGVGRVATLPALLSDVRLVPARHAHAQGAQAVLAWGLKPSARRAEAWALRHRLPVLRIEDGFLRSVGLGPDEPPLSIVVDDWGIYYDASRPSRLEQWVAEPLTEARCARADQLRRRWCEGGVSKYNLGREPWRALPPGREDLLPQAGHDDVLVVDQTAGDASIAGALAGPESFARMLLAAVREHPQGRIWLKVHPDVLSGRKRGHHELALDALSESERRRVRVLSAPLHPAALLARVSAVYVVSSQLGFEALLWGKPVRCFGMPFYAGWGLTHDELPPPVRRPRVALQALVHAALVDYARYVHPETGKSCSPEALIDWMSLQRRERERFAPCVRAVGFSGWKLGHLRRFMAGSEVVSAAAEDFGGDQGDGLDHSAQVTSGGPPEPVVLWGRQAWVGSPATPILRVEDGFLRSVGLGADLAPPVSWVIDRQGLYYDASRPSDLEDLIRQGVRDNGLLARARALRQRIVAAGLSKYNLGGEPWQRPPEARSVVLVVGQVESDASLALGAPGIQTNLALLQAVRAARPQAHVVYRPHPDVASGLRRAGAHEHTVVRWCNEVAATAELQTLLAQVDEVHVLTSLAGWEALLRGRRVVCWGLPFYAGWGLTEDRLPAPRRGVVRSIDELVAAALILYPTYVSRRSGRFTTPERALEELTLWRAASVPAPIADAPWWTRLRRWMLSRWVGSRRQKVPVLAPQHDADPTHGPRMVKSPLGRGISSNGGMDGLQPPPKREHS